MRTTKAPRRLDPKVVATQLMEQFPKEPHEALARMRSIPGSDAIPVTYWTRVEREISALAKRRRFARKAYLCTCRVDGKRNCIEHGGGDAESISES